MGDSFRSSHSGGERRFRTANNVVREHVFSDITGVEGASLWHRVLASTSSKVYRMKLYLPSSSGCCMMVAGTKWDQTAQRGQRPKWAQSPGRTGHLIRNSPDTMSDCTLPNPTQERLADVEKYGSEAASAFIIVPRALLLMEAAGEPE